MITFGMVGTGWRTHFFLRIARACPDRFRVVGVVSRSPANAAHLTDTYGVRVFGAVEDLISHDRPQFMVTSVTWDANPPLMAHLVGLNVPILSETPPGRNLDDLHAVYALTQQGGPIQVAEQYHLQPAHAARLAFAHGGKLGRISQAQVSVAHGYHGISLIRRYLGIQYEPVTVTASAFTSPIIQSPNRNGPPATETLAVSRQTIAHFDFGDRLGIFDFCGDQYFSYIRGQRLLVRGERGEIIDHQATYLQDQRTPIQVSFIRHVAGANGNLEGHHLKGIQAGEQWVYHNPLAPGELSDDEIAVGACLLKMAECVETGQSFYSLAEACHDRYLDILMTHALDTGAPVTSTPQPWSNERRHPHG